MSIQLERNPRIPFTFLLDEAALQRLFALLKERTDNVEIKMTFSDQSSVETTSWDRLLQSPNRKGQEIAAVQFIFTKCTVVEEEREIDGKRYPRTEPRRQIIGRVEFDAKDSERPIVCAVKGQEDLVNELSDKLDTFLSDLRQPYSRLLSSDFVVICCGVLFSLPFTILTVGAFSRSMPLWIKLGSAGLMLFCIFLPRILKQLFPAGTFAIGMGKHRHEQRTRWRFGITTILVGVVVAIFGHLIYDVVGGLSSSRK